MRKRTKFSAIKNMANKKLFHGYVLQPWPMVIICCLVGLMFLAFAIWVSFKEFRTSPLREPDSVIVSFCEIEEGWPSIYLHSEVGVFALPIKAIDNVSAFQDRVYAGEFFEVFYIPCDEVKSSLHELYGIYDLKGVAIASEESLFQANRLIQRTATAVIWGITILYWGIMVAAYKILNNAPNHPILASLLVRRAYRNF